MFGYEIASLLSKIDNIYENLYGICSIDIISSKEIPYLQYLIINLSKNNQNGSHW